MPRQQRTFARKISGKWYRILAYRCPESGSWRQKSQGAVTPQEAWRINEDWRLQQKADDLPEEPQDLVEAYLKAVGDLGLVLGAIGNRLPNHDQAGFAVAVAALGRGHDQVVDLVAADEEEQLPRQVERAVGFGIVLTSSANKETRMRADQRTTEETVLPPTRATWVAMRRRG